MPILASLGAGAIGSYRFLRRGISAAAVYVEDVFSTTTYIGNGQLLTLDNSLGLGNSGDGYSALFNSANTNSTASYVTVGDANNWTFLSNGASDWTVEFSVYSYSANAVAILGTNHYSVTGAYGMGISLNSVIGSSVPNSVRISFTRGVDGSRFDANTAQNSLIANAWNHVAVTFNSTTKSGTFFINGSNTATYNASAFSFASADPSNPLNIGRVPPATVNPSIWHFSGHLTNLRVSNNVRSDFTSILTTPLTSDANTVLLCMQGNNTLNPNTSIFVDQSNNNYTIRELKHTVGGDYYKTIKVTKFGPYTSTTANSAGLIWTKRRSATDRYHLIDTVRGFDKFLSSDQSLPQQNVSSGILSLTTSGYTLGSNTSYNSNNQTYVAWTFKKQPKFFDIVTWTGNGANNRTISHSLGSTPGFVIVKKTSGTTDGWAAWHRSLPAGYVLELNLSQEQAFLYSQWFGGNLPTSTSINLGTDSRTNGTGDTYIAYLFAHDAGGFGANGTSNVITCGSTTVSGTGYYSVDLGYEPQWLLIKNSTVADDWYVADNMRGLNTSNNWSYLRTNLSTGEFNTNNLKITPTGFSGNSVSAGSTVLYVAIRRGPMKTPSLGSEVFYPVFDIGGTGYDITFNSLSYPDLTISWKSVTGTTIYNRPAWNDRVRGMPSVIDGVQNNNPMLASSNTDIEGVGNSPASSNYFDGAVMNRVVWAGGWNNYVALFYGFKRAPGFLDIVGYDGNGNNDPGQTVTHNLGVAPELIIVRNRTSAYSWEVWHKIYTVDDYIRLNETGAKTTNASFPRFPVLPTETTFNVGGGSSTNGTSDKYIAYLFATVPGVSKVGSYTGTGTTQTIDCGFTTGARFVLIKWSNGTGNWYVWDAAQGIVSGNDPYLLLNSQAVQVTNTDYIDPVNAGFQISSTAPIQINDIGGTFIFLAIA